MVYIKYIVNDNDKKVSSLPWLYSTLKFVILRFVDLKQLKITVIFEPANVKMYNHFKINIKIVLNTVFCEQSTPIGICVFRVLLF